MLGHAARVKRLTSRHAPITIFDLETSDKLTSRHKAAPGATGRRHPLTFLPGTAPEWASMRFALEQEPSAGWPIPTGKTMQLAAARYEWDATAGAYKPSGAVMDRLVADPDLLECCLDPNALATHGISLEHAQREGLSPTEVWTEFLEMVGDGLIMGQNILKFDVPFANSDLLRAGFRAQLDPARSIDLILLAREVWSFRSNRLRALADFFGVTTDPDHDHDAMADITTSWGVWEAMQSGLIDHAVRFGAGAPLDQYRGRLGGLGNAWGMPDASELVPQMGAAPPLGADGKPASAPIAMAPEA